MANLPQWRSLDQIVGGMAVDFVGRLDDTDIAPGLDDIKPGSPFLALFHAVGQSQVRSQQQMMTALDANDIDNPAADLDHIGAAEGTPRRGQSLARGRVDFVDTSFQRIGTKLYHGAPAPISGTLVLNVADGSAFPPSGSVYIGRGTTNVEGPLPYTQLANLGASWTITLQSATQQFHAVTEAVTLAQGGDRIISAGQVVRTPQSNTQTASFATTRSAVIADGEVSVTGVPVLCQKPGMAGNMPAGAITEVVASATQGMTVRNPLPIAGGFERESNDDYRARIKAQRQSRHGGTKTAIETNAIGIAADDEEAVITTATLVRRRLRPSMLVIDDGTGYEERVEEVAYEVLVDSANGGETDFNLIYSRPAAKAAVTTGMTAPFSLWEGAVLAVEVGGRHCEHVFSATGFRAIGNATAFEVVSSVNSNPALTFSARTSLGGTAVTLFAKSEENDDVRVVIPFAGTNANTALGFSPGRTDTLRLYRNDHLLAKDGQSARLTSLAQGNWRPMASPELLTLDVDGTGERTYTFLDADFVALGLSGLSGQASLNAWAAVLNARLPGVSVTVNGSFLELVSNLGADSRASLSINPGTSTLVSKGMFGSALSAVGRGRDYIFSRSLGLVELAEPLQKGDRLTAATLSTRAYSESGNVSQVVVPPGGAHIWVFVDGAATLLPNSLNGSSFVRPLLVAGSAVVTLTALSVAGSLPLQCFGNVRVGDWLVLSSDTMGLSAGARRVCEVDASGTYVRVECNPTGLTLSDSSSGVFAQMAIVRSSAAPQSIAVQEGTYTLSALVDVLNQQLVGARASVNGSRFRITTNSYGSDGGLGLMAEDQAGQQLLGVSSQNNNEPHVASIESASELGTPSFSVADVGDFDGVTLTDTSILPDYKAGLIDQLLWVRPLWNSAQDQLGIGSRYGTLNGRHTSVKSMNGTTNLVPRIVPYVPVTGASPGPDRAVGCSLFRLGPESYLDVTLNDDPLGHGFSVPLFRRLVVDQALAYGQTVRLLDGDATTGPAPLGDAFGPDFDFADFALHARARGITHPTDPTRSILWRLSSFSGAVGQAVNYRTIQAGNEPLAVTVNELNGDIDIALPSNPVLTAAQLAQQVNALGTRVTATVLGTGTGTLTQTSGTDAAAKATLVDGLLQIQSRDASSGDITLKWSPSAALAGDTNDWANETFRLVPTTARNVADFLSTPAVSGLSLAGAAIETSGRAEHVQLTSRTLGSLGCVQVTGGTANELLLTAVGSGSSAGSYLKVPVRTTTSIATLPTMAWLEVQTTTTLPKHLDWLSTSTIAFDGATKKVTLGGGATAWTQSVAPVTGARWYVERHGRFAAYTLLTAGNLTGASAGDWVEVAGGDTSQANLGRFRVIFASGNTFWVDNAAAVAEDVTIDGVTFYRYDSVQPGDVFQVGTGTLGNQGVWTVTAIDPGDHTSFFVAGPLVTVTSRTISSALAFLRVTPAAPVKSFARCRLAIVDPLDPMTTNLYLDWSDTGHPELLSKSAGAVLRALDRLSFPTSLVRGHGGYSHSVGLIAAANRVLYGDESDPKTYPGCISAHDDIAIGPPLVRRTFVSVAIREVSGSDTSAAVKAAIASVINSAGGRPVAISKYLEAAQRVVGVLSVVPISPVPTTGADVIPVQPGEKPVILDLDDDIRVDIIGQ